MNIYVGNLSYDTGEDELREAFAEYGEVKGVNVIQDRDTGRSKGFGFVEMLEKDNGDAAIKGLDGTPLQGRDIRVNEARPREEKPRRERSSW